MGTTHLCSYRGLSALKNVSVGTIPGCSLLYSKRDSNAAMCHTAESERQVLSEK